MTRKVVALAENDLDRYAGIAEVALRLNIGQQTVYDMIRDGRWDAEIGVPIVAVAGKQVVSLRRLAEYMYGAELEVAS